MAVKDSCFASVSASLTLLSLLSSASPGVARSLNPASTFSQSPAPIVTLRSQTTSPSPFSTSAPPVQIAQGTPLIQSISLDNSKGQLVIQSSQTLTYSNGWDRGTGAYRILLSAPLAPNVSLPTTGANTLLLRLEVQQDGSNTVLLLYPASGVQIGQMQPINANTLQLSLSGATTVLLPPGTIEPDPLPGSSPQQPITQLPTQPRVTQPVSPIVRPRSPVGSPLIVIDPGHGGPDPGAVGIGGIQEKEIVLDVSHQVSRLLQSQGVQVVMTRQDDRDLGLAPRSSLANQVNATAFVSIHANAVSLSRPEVNGVETFHYSESSRPLAASIQKSILEATGMNSRGVKQARFYVLRYTRMPSALVEIGFVTGAQDAPRLADPGFRTTMSQAIAQGILRYLGILR